jgi:hypothetical protein
MRTKYRYSILTFVAASVLFQSSSYAIPIKNLASCARRDVINVLNQKCDGTQQTIALRISSLTGLIRCEDKSNEDCRSLSPDQRESAINRLLEQIRTSANCSDLDKKLLGYQERTFGSLTLRPEMLTPPCEIKNEMMDEQQIARVKEFLKDQGFTRASEELSNDHFFIMMNFYLLKSFKPSSEELNEAGKIIRSLVERSHKVDRSKVSAKILEGLFKNEQFNYVNGLIRDSYLESIDVIQEYLQKKNIHPRID